MHDEVTVRTQPLNVTLNLLVVTYVLTATLCLDEVDICIKVFSNVSMHDKVTVRPQNSSCENDYMYLQTTSVSLTLEVGTKVLNKTSNIDVVDIYIYRLCYIKSAKLFQIPIMHGKVTVRTWMLCNCESTDIQTDRRTMRFWYSALRGIKSTHYYFFYIRKWWFDENQNLCMPTVFFFY
jgi:hypothetical protein